MVGVYRGRLTRSSRQDIENMSAHLSKRQDVAFDKVRLMFLNPICTDLIFINWKMGVCVHKTLHCSGLNTNRHDASIKEGRSTVNNHFTSKTNYKIATQ